MLDQFVKMTQRIIAEDGFDNYLPTLLLPATAVREGRAALLEDGRVRWVKVSTDERIAGQLPVTAGLSAGQQVIVPAPLLDDGARVKAQP